MEHHANYWNNTTNGYIVVMHFDSSTTTRSTAAVLPELIDHLRASGYELTTITDLLTGGTQE